MRIGRAQGILGRRMSSTTPRVEDEPTFLDRLLSVRREERAPVLLGVATFFCILFAIFLLRPLRDEMGLRSGARNLKYLWVFTLVGTMAASVAFAAVCSRFSRREFMARTWRGVALTWLAFLPLSFANSGALGVNVGRVFYVVHAVSNVFVVSLYWAQAADLFTPGRAKRLFGLIAVGGTLGAMAGSAATGLAASSELAIWMIVPAALLMELAVRLSRAQAARTPHEEHAMTRADLPLGGDAFEGLRLIAARPYLAGIALFTLLFGVVQTFFTLQQNHIVEAVIPKGDARTEYFAWTENAAQTLTLLVQLFVTGRLMSRLGVGGALLVLPVIGVIGFSALWTAHTQQLGALGIVTACVIAWRGLSHSTQRPAREALYVTTERVEKYKAKSFTDTFAFRGGDLAGAFGFDVFTLSAAALAGAPLALAWGGLGLWLARRQSNLVESGSKSNPAKAANDA